MHYRFGYLFVRSLFHATRHRRPAALGMVWGYGSAALHREPRWADDEARRPPARAAAAPGPPGPRPRGPREARLAVCGICGVVQMSGAPRRVVAPEVLDRMTDVDDAPRAGRPRHVSRPTASRSARAGSASSTSRAATSRSRTRTGASGRSRTARSTTTTSSASDLAARGHRFASRCDTEVLPHLYEEHGAGVPASSCAACSAIAVWDGRGAAASIARDRLGDQAALLRARRRPARLRAPS